MIRSPNRAGKVEKEVVASRHLFPKLGDMLFEGRGYVMGDVEVHWMWGVVNFFSLLT